MPEPTHMDLSVRDHGDWKAGANVPFSGAWVTKQLADRGVMDSIIFPEAGSSNCTEQPNRFVSAMHSDHDLPGLLRSARRQSQSHRRAHDRRKGLPEDELAILRRHQASQEAEWRRILRVQQGRNPSSSGSSSSSWAKTRLPAGLKPQEDFRRRYHAHGPGNVRLENLPLETSEQVSRCGAASEVSASSRLSGSEVRLESIPGGLQRLSQLLRCDGVRP